MLSGIVSVCVVYMTECYDSDVVTFGRKQPTKIPERSIRNLCIVGQSNLRDLQDVVTISFMDEQKKEQHSTKKQ